MKFTFGIATAAVLMVCSQAHTAHAKVPKGAIIRRLQALITADTPGCVDEYDGQDENGNCVCGPGRIPSGDLCVTPQVEGQFEIFPLEGPVHVDVPFTVSEVFQGPTDILDSNQCAAIAVSQRSIGADGFYYQGQTAGNPGATTGCLEEFDTRNPNGSCDCGAGRVRVPGSTTECQFAPMNGQCWLLSFSMTYGTPSAGASGFPYVADANGGQRLVKRGIPETGTVGQDGGSIAYVSTADPNGSATVGCLEEFDTRNPNGTCDCGAGRVRVDGSTTECRFAASPAARMKVKRIAAFNGVPW